MWRLPALLAMLSACNEAGIRVSNDAPEAEIVDPAEGGQVFEGVPVTLDGAATDSDNAEFDLEARWRVDGVTVCDWSEADDDGTTTCEAALVGGAAGQIVLQVRDPRGASGSDRISVVVVPTDAPTATITAPEPDGVYYSDQLITLAGVVADAEDAAEALTATWTSTSGVDLTRVNATPTSDGSVEGSALLLEGLDRWDADGLRGLAPAGADRRRRLRALQPVRRGGLERCGLRHHADRSGLPDDALTGSRGVDAEGRAWQAWPAWRNRCATL